MKILTIYAHPNPKSFNHAILEHFTKGLKDAGHTNEVVDLYAIKFNPVLKMKDYANWIPHENATDVAGKVVNEEILTPYTSLWNRVVAWFMFRNKSSIEIINILNKRGLKDVREQQKKVELLSTK